jgi:hypothetical protein
MKHGTKGTRRGQHVRGGWTRESWAAYSEKADMMIAAILSPAAPRAVSEMNERED